MTRALRVLWRHRFMWRLPIGLGFAIESLVQGFGLISLFFVLGAVVLTWDTNAF